MKSKTEKSDVFVRSSIVFLSILVAVSLTAPPGVLAGHGAGSEEDAAATAASDIWHRDTLTGNWFGLGEDLEESGVSVALSATQIFQYGLSGGTEAGVGRQSGSYDLEVEADAEKLVGLPGGHAFMLAEGSWAAAGGLDARAVGSSFGINDDFGGERFLDVTELWWEQHLADGRLKIRAGKVDLTGGFVCRGCPVSFDGNLFANDETAQFLNGALVNNPSVPFPDNGLGLMVYAEPVDGWYAGFGVADADADARETGFNTTFDGDSDLFYIAETGVVPIINGAHGRLRGSYRIGLWHLHQQRADLDGTGTEDDDVGVYVSADQMVWRENATDEQGLGLFGRLGWADDDVNAIRTFASGGLNYRGPIPGRDADVLGAGYAWGKLSSDAGFGSTHERAVEFYYNAELTPWLHVSPSVQWLHNPGGSLTTDDATVVGLRLQMNF